MSSVSVLVLSYNHVGYIEEAINSVFKQKDYIDDLELIVLDDGSNDGSQDLLLEIQRRAPISMEVVLNEHQGVHYISRNFNTLIKLAKKQYIAFLSSDDAFVPDRFRKQIEMIENDEKCQFVYAGGVNLINGKNIGEVHPPSVVEMLKKGDPTEVYKYVISTTPLIYIQSILAKSSFLKSFEPFNENLIADDWVFNINCFKRLVQNNQTFGYLDEVVILRNVLESSTSNNAPVHFKRVAQTAEIYISNKETKFYKSFYWQYMKTFLLRRHPKKFIILSVRLVLLYTSVPFHNKWLSKLI